MRMIIGAGLAGLLAAHAWPRAKVAERMRAPTATHAAVLRFRSDVCAQITGVPFRRVRVHKGLWSEGRFSQPTVRLANLYARKVAGALGGPLADRSVWNLQAADRWVAPSNLYERWVEGVGARIEWGCDAAPAADTVSTAPLPATLAALGVPVPEGMEFRRAPIYVQRWRMNTDLFQTVYFPDEETGLYRASITGDTLIAESMDAAGADVALLERVFGVPRGDALGAVEQRHGKIVPLQDGPRRVLLRRVTADHGVWSLGRFATWRNVLLDDVAHDITVIKQVSSDDAYGRVRAGVGA
jgi:hypothetical protein